MKKTKNLSATSLLGNDFYILKKKENCSFNNRLST